MQKGSLLTVRLVSEEADLEAKKIGDRGSYRLILHVPPSYHIFFSESRKTLGLKLGSSDSTRERGKECNFCGEFGKLTGHF
jgi:hypothetical protein